MKKQRVNWMFNFPKKGQKSLFIDGKIAKSQVVPRDKNAPVVDEARPVTRKMSRKEKLLHGTQPKRN